MLILELVINALARAKLDARQISRRDTEQVIANGPLVIENPHARVAGSVFVIGHTDALRFITLVLQTRPRKHDALARHDRLGVDPTTDRGLPRRPLKEDDESDAQRADQRRSRPPA